jgi:hypothetical protein
MEQKTTSSVLSTVGVESIDSFADDGDDVNVNDVNWHVTKRGGESNDGSDGKMTTMTNAFDLLFHR